MATIKTVALTPKQVNDLVFDTCKIHQNAASLGELKEVLSGLLAIFDENMKFITYVDSYSFEFFPILQSAIKANESLIFYITSIDTECLSGIRFHEAYKHP